MAASKIRLCGSLHLGWHTATGQKPSRGEGHRAPQERAVKAQVPTPACCGAARVREASVKLPDPLPLTAGLAEQQRAAGCAGPSARMAAVVIQAKKKAAMDFRQSIHEDGVEQLRDHFKKVGLCEQRKTRQRVHLLSTASADAPLCVV